MMSGQEAATDHHHHQQSQRATSTSSSSSKSSSPAKRKRSIYKSLALGQVLSILIAATGIFSSQLSNHSISIPTTQSSLSYALLSFYLFFRRPPSSSSSSYSSSESTWRGPLRIAWWKYLLLAIIDVEANFLVRRKINDWMMMYTYMYRYD